MTKIKKVYAMLMEKNIKLHEVSLETNDLDIGKECLEDRTKYSKTFQKPGQKEILLYSEPVHYQDDEGNWRLIDTNIKKIT